MSERHRRRHNWEGVVLSQRVQLQRTEQLFQDEVVAEWKPLTEGPSASRLRRQERMRKRFAPVFDRFVARARVDQGIDRWEDDGGSFR